MTKLVRLGLSPGRFLLSRRPAYDGDISALRDGRRGNSKGDLMASDMIIIRMECVKLANGNVHDAARILQFVLNGPLEVNRLPERISADDARNASLTGNGQHGGPIS
jgi:hypothetical protein